MTKSSWRCYKKAWLALSVVVALAVAMGGASALLLPMIQPRCSMTRLWLSTSGAIMTRL